jgi:hypothetical protein
MNSLALGIVLFIVYFCFISCCLYKPKSTDIKRETEKLQKSNVCVGITPNVIRKALIESDPEPIETSKVVTIPVAVFEQAIATPAAPTKQKETANNAFDLDALCLRHARIACKTLGIKQNQKLTRLQVTVHSPQSKMSQLHPSGVC